MSARFIYQCSQSTSIYKIADRPHAGCPNNFSKASHPPFAGQNVVFLLRKSDTAPPYEPPGVALQDGQDFVGWIRVGLEKDLIASRLQSGEHLIGSIDEILREFEWDRGGGLCYEGLVTF